MCGHNSYVYLWLNGRLQAVDQCMGHLVLQLNTAGIKTVGACCGHGKGYPNVTCVPGTEQALSDFGCKIIVTRQGVGKVEAYFPANTSAGHVYAAEPDWVTPEDS